MAQKASDDNSTPVVWLQLYAVRALVARELQVTPLEAEELILEYASRGHFRRCGGKGSYIDQRHWGASHPELGVYVPVDFTRSVVRHISVLAADATRYTTRLALDDHLEPYKRSNVEMREAHLARDDVLSMLRELGSPPEQAQTESSTSEGTEESAAKSISAPAPKEKSKSPKEETADIRPKDWLFREFDRVPCQVDGQAEYLHGVHERINKAKSVRRRRPISLKTVQNRYAEWKELPKRQPK
jgi:hypothetical protein